jgi:hypothetical protein
LLLLVAVPVGGCGALVGIGDGPPLELRGDAGGDATCGVGFASSKCEQCMSASCCTEAASCVGAPGCADFAGCVAACLGDVACATACRDRFPTGYAVEAASLESCKAMRCASACGVTCGGYVYPNAACAACGIAHCCDVATACMGDAECAALGACERACPINDARCLERCELASTPGGVTRERDLGACLGEACPTSCIPPKWACLQNLAAAAAPATGPAIRVTYRFIEYGTIDRVKQNGLRVRACRAADVPCDSPLVNWIPTDEHGEALLAFGDNHFDGYAEISGPGYQPFLLYLPPLTKDFVADVGVIKIDDFALLANSIAKVQPDAATVLVTVFDCAGGAAGGVKLAVEPASGTPFYFAGGSPSGDATVTDENRDTGSIGGFVNVLGGTTGIKVRATVAENGLTYPERIGVHARKTTEAYTMVYLRAAP